MVRVRRGRFGIVGALSFAAALVTTTHASRACIIIPPEVVLPASRAAPRNTHIWYGGTGLPYGATFALVAEPGSPPAPALDVRMWALSMLLEIVPRAPLAANARYDLWASPHQGKWEKRPGKPVLLGTFRTGDDVDTAPPSRPVVRRAVGHPVAMSCDAWLQIELEPAADRGPAADLYAVWFADADGRIAYETPPEEVASVTVETQSLDVQIPSRAKVGLRVGVRALDVAGNLSAPVETTVVAP